MADVILKCRDRRQDNAKTNTASTTTIMIATENKNNLGSS